MSAEILLEKLCAQTEKVHAAAVARNVVLSQFSEGPYEAIDFQDISDYVDSMKGAASMLCDQQEAPLNLYVEHDDHGVYVVPFKDDSHLMLVTDPVLGAGLDKLRASVGIFAKRIEKEAANMTAPPAASAPSAEQSGDGLRLSVQDRLVASSALEAETAETTAPAAAATPKKRFYRGVEY